MAGKPKWVWKRVTTALPATSVLVWMWGPDHFAVTLGYFDGRAWRLPGGEVVPRVTIWHPLDKPDLPTVQAQIE